MPDYTVQQSGLRLDLYLVQNQITTSRSEASKWIQDGFVRVNGQKSKVSYKVQTNDIISVEPPAIKTLDLIPHKVDFSILHEDDDILVLDKPSGLVVHPGAGNYETSLVHGLLHHCKNLSGIGGVERPGIVHRLDKGTSGLMVVAKNDISHQSLTRQFQERQVQKEYHAIVAGQMQFVEQRLENLMKRSELNRKKFVVNQKKGKKAITHVTCLQKTHKASYVKLGLETGRTHQIRVHLSYISHPILGDDLYGGTKKLKLFNEEEKIYIKNLGRPMLHSYALCFFHPKTQKKLEFQAGLPNDMLQTLKKFELIGDV